MTEHARQALARIICREYTDEKGQINAVTLDPRLEQKIADSLKETETGAYVALDPVTVQKIIGATTAESKRMVNAGLQPIVVCSPRVRPYFKQLIKGSLPGLVVLSFAEISQEAGLHSERMVSIESET